MKGNCTCTPLIASLALGTGLVLTSAMMVDTSNAAGTGSNPAIIKAAAKRQDSLKGTGANARPMQYLGSAKPAAPAGREVQPNGGIAGANPACPNPAHDCFTPGTPGCSDEVCCNAVCDCDPFCCTTSWDAFCAGSGFVPGCGAVIVCGLPPCDVTCPPGANQEIAPQCPVDGSDGTADPNGGCNSVPAQFDSIACGQTVCGEMSTYLDISGASFRDTDWYAFSLATDSEVTWTVNSTIPSAVFLLSGGCPTSVLFVGSGLCPNTVTACLAAGDYTAFVAPSVFSGFPCGGGNNAYTATLSCVPCKFTGPCASLTPDHDCLTTGTPGCTDIDCCNTVCTVDAFCCQTAWDGICVNEAATLCGFDPPANDNCEDRVEVLLGDTAFVTVGATTDGPPHASCDFFGDQQVNQDIWYNWTAPASGTLTVSLCGSSFDTKVAIYEGCTCPVSDANKLACNDDSCGLQSELSIQVTQGTCYKIRVGGFGTAVGSGNMNLTLACACSSCTADIAPAGGNGQVDIDDLFEVIGQWGPCD
jgi:hypothetical protein